MKQNKVDCFPNEKGKQISYNRTRLIYLPEPGEKLLNCYQEKEGKNRDET